jgi:hypothetical protein
LDDRHGFCPTFQGRKAPDAIGPVMPYGQGQGLADVLSIPASSDRDEHFALHDGLP